MTPYPIDGLPRDRFLTRRDLLPWMTDRELAAAVRVGALLRVRRGVYAHPAIDPLLRRAAELGGMLSCVSELSRRGVWVHDTTAALHVRFPEHGDLRLGRTAVRHWGACLAPLDRRHGHVALQDALADAASCLPLVPAVAAIDSSINLGLLSGGEAGVALRGRGDLLRLVDGRAESGLETYARLRLGALGLRCAPQVPLAGIGVLDLVVEDRIDVECDGDAWHSTPEARRRDRRRDAAVLTRGLTPLRFGFEQLIDPAPDFELAVIEAVRAHRRVKNAGAKADRALRRLEKGWFPLRC